jgi:hypothetical protein
MSNIVILDQYRSETRGTAEEAAAKAADLFAMSYAYALSWAGADFDRLLALARAKDYRPEWIAHQLFDRGLEPTPAQVAILDRMIAAAGPYISRRERWILRQLNVKPTSESSLVKLASKAAEYREYKHPDRCVGHDIGKLVARSLIRCCAGGAYSVTGGASTLTVGTV